MADPNETRYYSWNVSEDYDHSHITDTEIMHKPNTAFLSFILTVGTFGIAYFLKNFRNSKFLGRPVGLLLLRQRVLKDT